MVPRRRRVGGWWTGGDCGRAQQLGAVQLQQAGAWRAAGFDLGGLQAVSVVWLCRLHSRHRWSPESNGSRLGRDKAGEEKSGMTLSVLLFSLVGARGQRTAPWGPGAKLRHHPPCWVRPAAAAKPACPTNGQLGHCGGLALAGHRSRYDRIAAQYATSRSTITTPLQELLFRQTAQMPQAGTWQQTIT